MQYSVKTARDALDIVGEEGIQALGADEDFGWSSERRSDLPTVGHETIGRLTVFVSDARNLASRLQDDLGSIEALLGPLWWESRLADSMEEAKRDA